MAITPVCIELDRILLCTAAQTLIQESAYKQTGCCRDNVDAGCAYALSAKQSAYAEVL